MDKYTSMKLNDHPEIEAILADESATPELRVAVVYDRKGFEDYDVANTKSAYMNSSAELEVHVVYRFTSYSDAKEEILKIASEVANEQDAAVNRLKLAQLELKRAQLEAEISQVEAQMNSQK